MPRCLSKLVMFLQPVIIAIIIMILEPVLQMIRWLALSCYLASPKAILFPIEIQIEIVKANETEPIARSISISKSISNYSLLQLIKTFCFLFSQSGPCSSVVARKLEKIWALGGAKARARALGGCQRALSAQLHGGSIPRNRLRLDLCQNFDVDHMYTNHNNKDQ